MLPILPKLPPAILAGMFLGALLPEEYVGAVLGESSGLLGIVVATIIGAALPGGPMISFPLAVALFSAGAGMPQMVTLITAWSVLALHRVLVFELPLMGGAFVKQRLLASVLLAPLAGLLTELIIRLMP
ncbi:hypothetical protein CAI21_14770 [Alkalilimnicola ehrlichii]|uniref:Permease n=2 Tax=Alkalilimnicola ehrlichii TaxID=351052 RepID=A0A3E0WNB3_9GAMM|nr:hypothetical protein CAI21_14770 [Alkalilimnicola ehrlichii]RFA34452.1 hypothetical protein CAL65_15340 [Alkalilimnicola ehrlichii]